MVQFIRKLDIITFLAIINHRTIMVWEFENSFVIHLHLVERNNRVRLGLAIEEIDT